MWFVLSLGVAVAGPVVSPQAMELICSGSGALKVVLKTDDGVQEAAGVTLDCPLCLVAGTPPPAARTSTGPLQPLAHVLQPIAAVYVAGRAAAPLPARGPPSLS